MSRRLPLVTAVCMLSLACRSKGDQADDPSAQAPARADKPAAAAPPNPEAEPQPADAPSQSAELGEPAPDFELTDLDGETHELSSYAGKLVVLEWFNPGCPFVNYAHTKGELVDMAEKYAEDDVVWLAINSGSPGKQGHGVEANRAGKTKLGMDYPILLDEDGTVGKTYGAKKTPHMYVIDESGVLVYRGAIDNAPFGEVEGGGELQNYVAAAIADVRSDRPVQTAETSSYGCTVKYAG